MFFWIVEIKVIEFLIKSCMVCDLREISIICLLLLRILSLIMFWKLIFFEVFICVIKFDYIKNIWYEVIVYVILKKCSKISLISNVNY